MTIRGRTWWTSTGRLAGALWWALLASALPWALAQGECPVLLSPAAGEVLDNGRRDRLDDVVWDFRWSACEGAEAYQLVVHAPDASVAAIDVETPATESTSVRAGSYIVEGNLDGWTWRVRARFGEAWGPWSEVRVFSVEPLDSDPVADFGAPAECPVPLAPEPGAVLDNGRMDMLDEIVRSFSWTPCPGASEYWLLAMREGARYPAVSVTLTATRYDSASLGDYVAEGNLSGWWWRVRAEVDGVWQPWSVASAFSVEPPDTDAPQPELVTPALRWPPDGATLPSGGGYPLEPGEGVAWSFRWSHVPIAGGYRLVVTAPHQSEPFLESLLDGRETALPCHPSSGECWTYVRPGAGPVPADAGAWSWRVQARLGPDWGPWSEAGSFTVTPAPEPGGAEMRLEGRLEGWTHGPGRLEGFFQPNWPPLGGGALEADGSFTIHLPPLAIAGGVDNIDVDTDDGPVRMLVAWVFFIVQDDSPVGMAALATSLEAIDWYWQRPENRSPGDALVMWWFAERPATRQSSYAGLRLAGGLEGDLRHGWNTVLLRVVEADDGRLLPLTSTVAEPPDDVGWHWVVFGE
jgi:hypothetical protein